MRETGSRRRGDGRVWLGLALLIAGLIVGIFPLMPLAPAAGAMRQVPHWAAWQWGGMAALGVAILLWRRTRGAD